MDWRRSNQQRSETWHGQGWLDNLILLSVGLGRDGHPQNTLEASKKSWKTHSLQKINGQVKWTTAVSNLACQISRKAFEWRKIQEELKNDTCLVNLANPSCPFLPFHASNWPKKTPPEKSIPSRHFQRKDHPNDNTWLRRSWSSRS